MAVATMKRLSASIPDRLYERLENLADFEGRSLSNLVGYLLEASLDGKLQTYEAEGQSPPVNREPKGRGKGNA